MHQINGILTCLVHYSSGTMICISLNELWLQTLCNIMYASHKMWDSRLNNSYWTLPQEQSAYGSAHDIVRYNVTKLPRYIPHWLQDWVTSLHHKRQTHSNLSTKIQSIITAFNSSDLIRHSEIHFGFWPTTLSHLKHRFSNFHRRPHPPPSRVKEAMFVDLSGEVLSAHHHTQEH